MKGSVAVGTIGSPAMLEGDLVRRRGLIDLIEQSDIDHLFVADHISFHTGHGMDGIVNAATLAAMSGSLDVFIGVYLLALRHPVPVARQLSSLALSAPGRITLGVGIGGEDRHEMEICGVNPATRGRRTNHSLRALRLLLSGETVSYDCDFFSFDEAKIRPAPDPAIPVVVGGRSDKAIERAAKYADGWLGVWCSPGRFDAVTGTIDQISEESGRNVPCWNHGMQLWAGFADSKKAARRMIAGEMEKMYRVPFEKFEKYSPYGSPEEVAEFLLPYVEVGARILNIKPCGESAEAEIEAVGEVKRLLATELGRE